MIYYHDYGYMYKSLNSNFEAALKKMIAPIYREMSMLALLRYPA